MSEGLDVEETHVVNEPVLHLLRVEEDVRVASVELHHHYDHFDAVAGAAYLAVLCGHHIDGLKVLNAPNVDAGLCAHAFGSELHRRVSIPSLRWRFLTYLVRGILGLSVALLLLLLELREGALVAGGDGLEALELGGGGRGGPQLCGRGR